MARQDPLRNFRYTVTIDGKEAGFNEVTVAESSSHVIDYREGNDTLLANRKLSGLNTYGNITLKAGVTDSMDMINWFHEVADGKQLLESQRKVVIVTVNDEAGNPKAVYTITRAWPCKYT